MSKRTLFLIFALFVITTVLLVIALYNPSNSKPPQTTITVPKEPAAQTILLFGELSASVSSSINQKAKQTYSLPINIATGDNKVTAVQLELQFDPKVLTNVSITPGVFFKNPIVLLNQINTKTGRISYAFGISPTDQAIGGKGVVATLTFEAKSGTPQQTSILFLPKTLVTAQGAAQSVLKETNAAQFTVGINNSAPSAPPAESDSAPTSGSNP